MILLASAATLKGLSTSVGLKGLIIHSNRRFLSRGLRRTACTCWTPVGCCASISIPPGWSSLIRRYRIQWPSVALRWRFLLSFRSQGPHLQSVSRISSVLGHIETKGSIGRRWSNPKSAPVVWEALWIQTHIFFSDSNSLYLCPKRFVRRDGNHKDIYDGAQFPLSEFVSAFIRNSLA